MTSLNVLAAKEWRRERASSPFSQADACETFVSHLHSSLKFCTPVWWNSEHPFSYLVLVFIWTKRSQLRQLMKISIIFEVVNFSAINTLSYNMMGELFFFFFLLLSCDQSLCLLVHGTLFQSKNIIFVNQQFQSSSIEYILTLIISIKFIMLIFLFLCDSFTLPQ